MKYFVVYIAAISIVSAFVTLLDKMSAKAHRRRVPERTLFLLALLGGSVSMYIIMQVIRHKTRHKRFMIGLPLIFAFQLAVGILVRYLTTII